MNRLLVIGGASSDILHLKDRTATSAGGAGMYTAMAACRSGAEVTLFGPRPEPCPEELLPVAGRLEAWLGPTIPPAEFLRFEISYRNGTTEYLMTSLESERMLSPASLPADLSGFDIVHVTPMGDSEHQLSFVKACLQRGAKRVSAGTYSVDAKEKPFAVRAVLEQSDYFFMNDMEAK